MCGRFTLRTPAYKLAEAFGVEVRANLAARYNIAPSQDIAALRAQGDGQRELVMLRWGLVPGWAKDPAMGNRMINARAETVAEKPAFRAAFRQRRCLIPADGFFEWQKTPDGSKQPYLMARPDGEPFTMAGLWEHWQPPGTDEPLETCTIITTEANETVAPIHHRMPVILSASDREAWLDPAPPSAEALAALLRPAPDDTLIAQAVDRHVNNARHDDPACIESATNGLLL
jgi:putative SOS response-associated peptidase YedK